MSVLSILRRVREVWILPNFDSLTESTESIALQGLQDLSNFIKNKVTGVAEESIESC